MSENLHAERSKKQWQQQTAPIQYVGGSVMMTMMMWIEKKLALMREKVKRRGMSAEHGQLQRKPQLVDVAGWVW
tara:strand:+ start:505 stop:726 length:222 start_codon:yes stop_codon:yes gene_type:complete